MQVWATHINMCHGILEDVLQIMKMAGKDLDEMGRLTVLSFDEMKVSSEVEFDSSKEQVVGPYSNMLVIMARGLCNSWKQPVYVNFDTKIDINILKCVIKKLYSINFKVVHCVSDSAGSNVGLFKQLCVTYDHPYFTMTSNNSTWHVTYSPDVPRLLKLLRNWLLDTGFVLKDSSKVTKQPLEALLSLTSSELNVCHKLTQDHLKCEGPSRQNVRKAAQLLSHTVATALVHYKPGNDEALAINTGSFIETINNWFDLLNSYHPKDYSPFKSPYGRFLKEQNQLLEDVKDLMLTMRCNGRSSLMLFQKGILISISALQHLYSEVSKVGVKYILTHRLNQDILENLFSVLRMRGGGNDHPTPVDAVYRLRMVILGRNPGAIARNKNTSDLGHETFLVADAFKHIGVTFGDEVQKSPSTSTETASESLHPKRAPSTPETSEDALCYLAGWLAKKFMKKYPTLGCRTGELFNEHNYDLPTWVVHLSHGGLIEPSDKFRKQVFRMERLFKKFTAIMIPRRPNVVKYLSHKIMRAFDSGEIAREIVYAFVRQRIFIRIKYMNSTSKAQQKMRQSKGRLKQLRKLAKIVS